MPRGRGWPKPGRLPVNVRFGEPVRPEDGELPPDFAARMRAALELLLEEDRTTWYEALKRDATGDLTPATGPKAAAWRRIWDAGEPVADPVHARRAWPR